MGYLEGITMVIRDKNGRFAKGNTTNWKGGIRLRRGYVYIYSPDHPYKDNNNCYPEHRLIMEKHIGRYLNREEIVHHIDGNKANNTIDNLMLLPNKAAHKRYHKEVGLNTRFRAGHKARLKTWVNTEKIVLLRGKGIPYKQIGEIVGLSKSGTMSRYKRYIMCRTII